MVLNMKTKLTDAAKEYLQTICKQEEQHYVHLSVSGGGCAGFSYKWDFTQAPEQDDEIIDITITDKLVIDATSIMYLLGMEIDYKQELYGSMLHIKNPNVTSSCGCGESFNVL
jgi:iron-sulfur cluster assembly accessory protein